ncbi:hypothetical protein H4R34_004046 [Dimargaris verticillata]|uniref:Uncharacterized protein n=1 Tax=Dimargaris verticillata TaxID=2761393 RepID=A0A9W8B3D0_9FUNG|nr:hypothetical protein H4R34_004046 [Dimargaris verticillata]
MSLQDDYIEYKVVKKSFTSTVKQIVNAQKVVEFTKRSKYDGAEKVLLDGFSEEVVWEVATQPANQRKKAYTNASIFTKIEVTKKNAPGHSRYRFYWCGEEFIWKHYGYAGCNFKCVHSISEEVVADFHYITWSVLDVGKLKIFPQQHRWSNGFKEFLIFSVIDIVEDTLAIGRKLNSPAAGKANVNTVGTDSTLETTPFLVAQN